MVKCLGFYLKLSLFLLTAGWNSQQKGFLDASDPAFISTFLASFDEL
jgi:hypothetical protein